MEEGCRAGDVEGGVADGVRGAEFGGRREKYDAAEARAKVAKLGLWKQAKEKRVSPGMLKKSIREGN